uniref:Apple domain-containing protein n=1 Tax=Angiostrongylus cantonensis TaxID=6313 RepID=A0A0K0D125_ANGCA
MLQAALMLALSSTALAVFECSSQETTAFVRIARARLDGTPVVVSTAGMRSLQLICLLRKEIGAIDEKVGHDLTCAQYCRNNIEPTTGAQRVCASFNFDGRETCYFFDDAASPAGQTYGYQTPIGTSQLTANPSANNFYYEKTCLPGVSAHEACTYRSFSFERMRKTVLEGFVKRSVQVNVSCKVANLPVNTSHRLPQKKKTSEELFWKGKEMM